LREPPEERSVTSGFMYAKLKEESGFIRTHPYSVGLKSEKPTGDDNP
jgi:hypothetical protein